MSVAQRGQRLRISLAGNDGANDRHSCSAGDVCHHVMELQVHLRERLLHVLDVRGGIVQQSFALTQVTS